MLAVSHLGELGAKMGIYSRFVIPQLPNAPRKREQSYTIPNS